MPSYRFQCVACGLNFLARAPIGVREHKCVGCGSMVEVGLPRSVNVSVEGDGASTGPSTTGMTGVDYNADRAIGSYSRLKWREIAARQRDKIGVIQATGASGFDLSRNPDGSYRVMTPEERSASERSRKFHFNVMKYAPKK